MKEKSDVGTIFKIFNNMVQTQFQTKIQVFRTDNGKEYFNKFLGHYFVENGIFHQSSCTDTPNKMELLNAKISISLKLLDLYFLQLKFLCICRGEAVLIAAYLIN